MEAGRVANELVQTPLSKPRGWGGMVAVLPIRQAGTDLPRHLPAALTLQASLLYLLLAHAQEKAPPPPCPPASLPPHLCLTRAKKKAITMSQMASSQNPAKAWRNVMVWVHTATLTPSSAQAPAGSGTRTRPAGSGAVGGVFVSMCTRAWVRELMRLCGLSAWQQVNIRLDGCIVGSAPPKLHKSAQFPLPARTSYGGDENGEQVPPLHRHR